MTKLPILFALSILFFNPVFAQKKKKNEIPKEIVKSIPLLTNHLTSNCTTDRQKTDSIYSWITKNIEYNYNVIESTKPLKYQPASDVLKTKKAICDGYVYLMQAMLKEVGIQSEYIEGYTRPTEMDTSYTVIHTDHSWIAVYIDDKWQLADPTWDAGYVGRIPKKELEMPKRWRKEKTFKSSLRNKLRKKRIDRKIKNFEEKKENRDPYTNNFGFVFKPTKEWYFVDKDTFLLSHLPVLPQWQLKEKTITVNQFCDKQENLPGNFSNPLGEKIEFEILNEEYINKNLLDKWLYTAENGHIHNEYNFSIKAVHYHNFIGVLTDSDFKKTMSHLPLDHSVPIYETLLSMTDTVLIFGKAALDQEKLSHKANKKDMATKFKLEGIADKNNQKALDKLAGNLNKTNDLISKSLERNKKEKETVENKIEEVVEKYPKVGNKTNLEESDRAAMESLFKSADSLKNSINDYYAQWNKKVESTSLKRLFEEASYSEYYLRLNENYLSFNTLEVNREIVELDSLSNYSINHVSSIITDTLWTEIPGKDPFVDLKAYEQLIKKYKPILKTKEAEKKISRAGLLENYLYAEYFEMLNKHIDFTLRSEAYANFIRENLKEFKSFSGDIENVKEDVVKAKAQRKKQLNEELDNANERNMNLYNDILKNAKIWKGNFKAKMK